MSEKFCECGIPITTKKGIRYKDAKDDRQLQAHFDHQLKSQGKRATARLSKCKQQVVSLNRLLADALSVRGEKWIIRYEVLGMHGAGFYAMHDSWEGGMIGPFSDIPSAHKDMVRKLS